MEQGKIFPEQKIFIILDVNSIIHRAFHALPRFTKRNGEHTGAIYGFFLVFLRILKELKPFYLAACFDTPKPTFRHKEFKEYKAQRPKTPQELVAQILKIKEILSKSNIQIFEKEGYEADDLIGTVANRASKNKNLKIIIVSGDKDTLQLVEKNINIYLLKTGVKNIELFDVLATEKKYGFPAEQIVDFKALVGDVSDNVPGVPGVGEKTAIGLIKEIGGIDVLYQKIEDPLIKIKPSLKKTLIQYKNRVLLNKKLLQIEKNVPINFSLEENKLPNLKEKELISSLKDLEFFSLIEKFNFLKNTNPLSF